MNAPSRAAGAPPAGWALLLACTVTALWPQPGLAEPAGDNAAEPGPAELLREAKKLYEGLEYDQVVPLTEGVLNHPGASVDQRLDAYLLQGSSLAVIGDQIEAEKPFRFLLRGRPDFDMPSETPPKILQVFRKVQVEERAIVEQMAELERARVLKSLALVDEPLEEPTGGVPIEVVVKLTDPRGAVVRTELRYRRQGAPQFASLPLERAGGGDWRGQIPGEWSENEDGFVLEYYFHTAGADDRTLVELGSAQAPKTVAVLPGEVGDGVPFYQSVWFWGVTGAAATVVTVAAASSAGALVYWQTLPPAGSLPTVHLP